MSAPDSLNIELRLDLFPNTVLNAPGASLAPATSSRQSKDPGALFTNGRILTTTAAGLGDEPTFAEAMFIQDGVVSAIGTSADLAAKYASAPGVTTNDLRQQTVLPGFVDGHIHLLILGQSLKRVSLRHCKNLSDIRSAIKSFAAANPAVPRVMAKEWTHSMTPDGVTAADLDDLDPRPIYVDTKDLHSTWCNYKGLEELDVLNMTEDPSGGKIQRDENGRPNGVLSEGAVLSIVWPRLAQLSSIGERRDYMLAAIENYSTLGYTGFVDMAMDEPAWEALVSLHALRPDLPIRIAAYWLIKPAGDAESRLKQVRRAKELQTQFNSSTSPDLRVVGIKIVCDGIVDACTAFLSEPYAHIDSPPPIWAPKDLAPVVEAADDAGMQIALHAIGDASIKMAVDALERYGTPGRRHRIEHIELASPEDAKRLGKLGLTASIQPVHSDPAILRAWPRLIGKERCGRAFPYREMADGGALMALGTDSPTAPWDPLGNVYVATTRRSAREPESDEIVNEHFKLGVCEAIVAGTRGAAASVFADERTGSLEVGKMADFAVVDMEWDAEKLLKADMRATYFAGKKVWESC
ncbi:related to amidohydrolase family protein [Cephalotrichum gorgonifer]|uniref:Related to amidohydrolase family protein n=1 Tax=Cephalotrichum gorgonifer TaxID=2041049 RepID=A0AAE8SWT7_9PEZI|nr:related to amidohydrolase family protein [Cephalotrichum gorgonifer]